MINFLLGAIGLSVAGVIIWLIRRDHLHVSYGLGWIVVAGAFALLGFAPDIIDRVAARVGISYPPTLALLIAIALLVLKILLMDIERSQLDIRNQRLTQRLAMLEARLEMLPGHEEGGKEQDPGEMRSAVGNSSRSQQRADGGGTTDREGEE